jgi:putative spermidine/putrescine transport system permease protein
MTLPTRTKRRRPTTGPLVLLLALPGLLFLLLPILAVVPMSFTAGQVVEFPPEEWGLAAYRALFADPRWGQAIVFSLKVSAVAVVLSVVAAGFAAIGLSRRHMRGEALVTAVILAPLAMPVVVLALGTFQFFIQIQINGTLAGIALAHAVLGVPYVFLTVRAALSKLDMALVRSAMSLGAGTLDLLRWVYLPAILPALLSGALLVFVVSFDEVVVALFLAGPEQLTLPRQMFNGIRENITPTIAAVATLLILFTTSLLLALEWLRGRRR